MSYDVKALFTSVTIGPAINIIKKHLEQDKELQQRTTMTVNNIICLLELCLKNTYFLIQGRYYEQLEGAAMGSVISPLWQIYTLKILRPKSVEKICGWHFLVIKSAHRSSFLEHINSIDQCIQYAGEDSMIDGSMPFLDILVIPQPDGFVSAYRRYYNTDTNKVSNIFSHCLRQRMLSIDNHLPDFAGCPV